MSFDKIGRESVVNVVVEQIKQMIIKEVLKPGQQIPTEVDLMQYIGVGRNSIREAIKVLSAMGILEVRRGQGTFVATKVEPHLYDPVFFSKLLDAKYNQDLYELRVMFDSMVLFSVVKNAKDENFDDIEKNIIEMEEDYQKDKENIDINFFVKKDMEFHHLILEATNNPLITRFGEAILELFYKPIKKSVSQKNGVMRSIRNHKQLLKTIRNKNMNDITPIVEKSLEEWKDNWSEHVEIDEHKLK